MKLITNDDNNLAVLRVITSGIYYGDGGEKRRVYNGGRALTLWCSLTEVMLKHFNGSCPICLTASNLSPLEASLQNVSHFKIQMHKRFNRMLFIRTKTQSANFLCNRLCQTTKWHLNNSSMVKNKWKMRWEIKELIFFGWAMLFSCPVFGRKNVDMAYYITDRKRIH